MMCHRRDCIRLATIAGACADHEGSRSNVVRKRGRNIGRPVKDTRNFSDINTMSRTKGQFSGLIG